MMDYTLCDYALRAFYSEKWPRGRRCKMRARAIAASLSPAIAHMRNHHTPPESSLAFLVC